MSSVAARLLFGSGGVSTVSSAAACLLTVLCSAAAPLRSVLSSAAASLLPVLSSTAVCWLLWFPGAGGASRVAGTTGAGGWGLEGCEVLGGCSVLGACASLTVSLYPS